ncbi:MAG: hypothetical protein BWX45_00025 [Deltaproteobacteria bacterium ADurb.Bin002]|nr:MAG: hypothetical protein BWX45_00025 [Deltaproteobacteria bacterium ADurb.Bin002]
MKIRPRTLPVVRSQNIRERQTFFHVVAGETEPVKRRFVDKGERSVQIRFKDGFRQQAGHVPKPFFGLPQVVFRFFAVGDVEQGGHAVGCAGDHIDAEEERPDVSRLGQSPEFIGGGNGFGMDSPLHMPLFHDFHVFVNDELSPGHFVFNVFLGISHGFFEIGVHGQNGRVLSQNHVGGGRVFKDRPVILLALFQRFLGFLSFRDVAGNAEDFLRPVVFIIEKGDFDFRPNRRTVLAEHFHFNILSPSPLVSLSPGFQRKLPGEDVQHLPVGIRR